MSTYVPILRKTASFVLAILPLFSSPATESKSVSTGLLVETETRSWTWLGSMGALCENVGVNGAFRVNVEAKVEKGTEGKLVIRSMALFVTGAVVDKDSTTTTAKLEVKQGSAVVNTIVL